MPTVDYNVHVTKKVRGEISGNIVGKELEQGWLWVG